MTFKYTFIYTRFLNPVRLFSTSKTLFTKDKNDQEKLYDEIKELEKRWDGLDGQIEELFEDIKQEEKDFETQDSDGEFQETEVSRYVTERSEQKDLIVREHERRRSDALFDRRNVRENRSILLDYINTTTRDNIETLEAVEKQTSGAENYYGQLVETLDDLKNHEVKANEVLARYHENDLPPILPEENVNSPANNSSLIDDYADTSTEMPSYMDPED